MNKNDNKTGVFGNYLYNLSYQVLSLLLPLATLPYLTRVLGLQLGVFDYVQAVVGCFAVFGGMGIGLYGQREIAACKNDEKKRSEVFFELVILRFFTSFLSFAALYSAITLADATHKTVYLCFSLDILSSALDISFFYQGMENFRAQSLRNIAVKLLNVCIIFGFVRTASDFKIYLVGYVLTNLLGNVSMWVTLPKYIRRIPLSSLGIRKHIKPAILMFIPQIATTVYLYFDKSMIGMLAGNTDYVAIYSYAEKVVKIPLTVITSLNLVMLSRITSLHSGAEEEKTDRMIRASFNFTAMMSIPMVFGILSVANRFIPRFFGEGWESSVPVAMVLAPIVFFIGSSGVFGLQYLLPVKRMKEYTLSVTVGMVTNLVLNFVLIPKYLAVGAAIATAIAELSVLAVQLFVLRGKFFPSVFSCTGKYVIAGMAMGGVVYGLGKVMSGSAVGIAFQIGIGIAVYFLLLFILRDAFFMNTVKRLLRIARDIVARLRSKEG